jgi:dTDP-4-dehydrorhamnose 3,5-epimerase
MRIHRTELEGVLVLEPEVYSDIRGSFLETYNEKTYAAAGITEHFVQDNHSHSKRGVLRGLHYQLGNPQGKLIRVLQGEIYDVAVDIRPSSSSFGKWTAIRLNAAEHRTIWIPKGFAHGFYTLSESVDVAYKVTDFYAPQEERTLFWNDPELAIPWPLCGEPVISEKDRAGHPFRDIETQTACTKLAKRRED